MSNIDRTLFVGFAAIGLLLAADDHVANAQYPVAVTTLQPAVPAVVGYVPERRGLFGRRIVYRAVVAPVAIAPVAPIVTAARPALASPTVTVGYAPIAPVAPVRAYYVPAVPAVRYAPVRAYYAPVRSYYAPVAPAVVPVRVYRVPVTPYVPAVGY